MTKIVYQGTTGAYSEIAAHVLFPGANAEFIGYADYPDMFEALVSGKSDYIVVPIENTTDGSIYAYYDLLLEFSIAADIVVVKELKMKIRHNLLGIKGSKLEDIEEVLSHKSAIGQCRKFLRSHHIKGGEAYDTAGAVEIITDGSLRHKAAIGSVQAAHDYGAEILAHNIQDRGEENYTRFLLVSKTPLEGEINSIVKCSVIFCIKNERDSLIKSLSAFSSRGLDIVRIETRPLWTTTSWRKYVRPGTEGLWDSLFYIDFRGRSDTCRNAIEHLREIALEVEGEKAVRVLGMYPEGTLSDRTGEVWRKSTTTM